MYILQSRSTSEELLINAGICPQKKKRKRQLFRINQPLKSNENKQTYATFSSQRDRRELLPENETISQHIDTPLKTMSNPTSMAQSPSNIEHIDSRSEPDMASMHRPSLPLPSPKTPIVPQPQRNNCDSNLPNHGKCHIAEHANKSLRPLSSALPSPNRAQSQPPNTNTESIETKSEISETSNISDTETELPRSNSLKDIKHDDPTSFSRCRSSSDSDLSKLDKKHKNGLKINTETPPIKDQITCDYPFEFVECIISVLTQCSKLSVFTIRVLSELLIDFVQDRTMKNNGLNDKHYNALQSVWDSVKSQLSEYLSLESIAMETYFIDTFEEEWRSVSQQPRINTLIDNPIRILPPHVFHGTTNKNKKEETNSDNNTNTKEKDKDKEPDTKKEEMKEIKSKQLDQQQLIRKLERIRKSIHNLLHISRLKTELLGGSVSLPFVPRSEFKYYYRLQVALSTIAPGCLNCLVLMQSKKRRRVLFSIREPDWLLLFNRMKGRAGFALVYMAIPIHSIEGVLNKLDPRVVHLSIRSPVRPHDAAIPIASQKNKWSITLFFDSMFATTNSGNSPKNGSKESNEPQVGHKDALTALDYITMNRTRVRRRMMTEIQKLVDADQASE